MKNVKYNPRNKRIEAKIDGATLNLNPVIRTLHSIGNDIIEKRKKRNYIQIIHHDNYRMVCPYQLHGTASMASYEFRERIPNINPEIVNFASTEIGLGHISILNMDRKKHEEQILRALDDIGKTWLYTENKEEAEAQIKKYGIPLLISTKEISEEERLKKFRSDHIFIDETSLIKETLDAYDKAMLKKEHENKERYQSFGLDDLSLGVGLNLYQSGLVPIKLYEDN
ncbi:MAG: hypothetical protein AABW83_03430 [Nanoarchaeota archaeon]